MPETRVVNRHFMREDVYIGRGSKWGNQFVIGATYQGRVLTRESCIEAFRDWLLYSNAGVALQADLGELIGKRLGCYCAPKACHGDVLAELAGEEEND